MKEEMDLGGEIRSPREMGNEYTTIKMEYDENMEVASGTLEYGCRVKEEDNECITVHVKEEIDSDEEFSPAQEDYLDYAVKVECCYGEDQDPLGDTYNIGPSFDHVDYQAGTVKGSQDNAGAMKRDPHGPSKLKFSTASNFALKRPNGKNKFPCSYCSYSAKRKLNLISHMAKIHMKTENLMKCNLCGFSTVDKNSIRKHVEIHFPQGEKSFKCNHPNCNYSAQSKHQLIAHLGTKHRETKHLTKCPQCDFVTAWSNSLKKHLATHLSDEHRPFRCSHSGCSYSAIQSKGLKAHLWKTHGEAQDLKKCTQCDFVTAWGSYLQSHISTKHTTRSLRCSYPGCGFKTLGKIQLEVHLAKKHGEAQNLKKCTECEFVTTFSRSLKNHMSTHLPNEDKPFPCSYAGCSYSANQKPSLISHLATEHNETQYLKKCTYCDYVTPRAGHLRIHMATHLPNERKNFRCSYEGCDFSANSRQYLNAHLAKKHDETQYLKKCPQCDYVTAMNHHLKSHMVSHLPPAPKSLHCGYSGCDYRANRTHDLNAHMASKHGETQHLKQCPHCDYACVLTGNLKKHIATHLPDDEKLYQCSFDGCCYSAVQEKNLKSHITKNHSRV